MALEWWKTADLVDDELRDAHSRLRKLGEQFQAQQEALAEQQREERRRKAGIQRRLERIRARIAARRQQRQAEREQRQWLKEHELDLRRKAGEQLREAGLPITEETVQQQIGSGFTWAGVYPQLQAKEERETALKELTKEGILTADMDSGEAERNVQARILQDRATRALEQGQWDAAKELQELSDRILTEGFPEGYKPIGYFAERKPEEQGQYEPSAWTPLKTAPEKLVRDVGEGLGQAVSGIYRNTVQAWSAVVNAADLLARKPEAEWTPEEKAFMEEMQKHGEAVNELNMLEAGGREIHMPMSHLASSPPEELWNAYENLSGARTLVGEMTYPMWFAMPGGATATGARAGLKGIATRLAAKGTPLDRLAAATAQTFRVGLLPLEGIERLITLPFKGIGVGLNRIQSRRMVNKLAQAPRDIQDDVVMALEKLRVGQEIGPDDIAAASKLDRTLGEALRDYSAKRVPISKAASGVMAEKGLDEGVVTAAAHEPEKAVLWDDLLRVPSVEETVQGIYSSGRERQLANIIGRFPGGKGIVRRINPTLTPRETMAARRAQEVVASTKSWQYQRAPGVKALVNDMIRVHFPEGNIVKHFQIDEKGIQHAFRPKKGYENASAAIVDVLEHPYKWDLSPGAQKLSQIWTQVRESAIKELQRRGIHVNKKFYEEGAGYFPRMVTGGHGEVLRLPRVKFEKPRQYATQLEAIDNNIQYTVDPMDNIMAFLDHVYSLIGYNELKNQINVLGRTAKETVPISIRIAREQAARQLRGLRHAEQALQRARRGERLPEATLKTVERNAPDVVDALRRVLNLQGKERGEAAGKLLDTIRPRLNRAKVRSWQARQNYSKALEAAKSPQLGQFERPTRHVAFRGRVFPEEVARVLDEFMETGAGGFVSGARNAAQVLRTAVAAMDFSPLFIHGLPLLGRRPDLWTKTTALAFKDMFRPASIYKYMTKAENAAIRQRHPGIARGTHEYYAGLASIEQIPKVGKVVGKAYEPFERFFTAWGDIARVELAKALEPSFIRAGQADKLAVFVNHMTGVMEPRALGISQTQRAAESAFVFFAPRYTRASLALIEDLFKAGITGQEARRSLAQLMAGGAAFYQGVCSATGQEAQWDPSRPTFMTVKIGNRHFGIGSFFYGLLRLMADAYQSVAGKTGGSMADFVKVSRTANPLIKAWYQRASVLTGMFSDISGLLREGSTPTDFLGYPLEDLEDWAHWLFVEHMLPIAVQSQIPAPREEAPQPRWATLTAEMAGARTFPVDEYYDLRDKYAQQVYGKDWNDLWQPTKGGQYRLSNRQEVLLRRFPDLREAYEKHKEKTTERWQAQHGLLPDEEAIRDAYALERYGKGYDELNPLQKRVVDVLIERQG